MFHAASLMLLNKIDLLPHLQFDVDTCVDYARRVNPSSTSSASRRPPRGLRRLAGWLAKARQTRNIGAATKCCDCSSVWPSSKRNWRGQGRTCRARRLRRLRRRPGQTG